MTNWEDDQGRPNNPYAPRGNVGSGSAYWGQPQRVGSNPDPVHRGRYVPLGPLNGQGGLNISGPYEPVVGWPEAAHPGEWRTGSGRGVYAHSPDRVIAVYGGELPAYDEEAVWGPNIIRDLRFTEINSRLNPAHRHCHEIVVYNRDGKIMDNWDRWADELQGYDLKAGFTSHSGYINRIRVSRYDPESHIWIVAQANAGIFKFANDGSKLVMKVNSDNVPEKYHPLVFPQDIAYMPNGDFLIAHMHAVMRFSKDGEFLSAFGKPGSAPGEFDFIHGIVVHPETLDIYIYDRMNARMQVFDQDGNFISQWPNLQGVYTIRLTEDGQNMWTSNGTVHKFLKYDLTGKLIREATWGSFGIAPGAIWGPHDFDTDIEGNLYVAEDYSGRVQKFQPMADADPGDPQLIGQLAR